jgi:hypothetical protein
MLMAGEFFSIKYLIINNNSALKFEKSSAETSKSPPAHQNQGFLAVLGGGAESRAYRSISV